MHKLLVPSQVSIMVVKEDDPNNNLHKRNLHKNSPKNPFNFRRLSQKMLATDIIPITFSPRSDMLRPTLSSDISSTSIKTPLRRVQPLKTIFLSPTTCDIASILKMAKEDDSIIDESDHVSHPIYKFPSRPTITPVKIFHTAQQRTIKAPFTTAQKPTNKAFPLRPKKCFKYKNLRLMWQEKEQLQQPQIIFNGFRRFSAPHL